MRMVTLADELESWLEACAGRGAIAATVTQLGMACARLADLVGRAPLAAAHGLDLAAQELITTALRAVPVASLLPAGAEGPLPLAGEGSLAVALDPLDGARNLEGNGPLGTVFSLLPGPANDPEGAFCQPGTRQLAAGFAMYGRRTVLVLTLGAGTHLFTLDRTSRRFVRSPGVAAIPPDGGEHAINAADWRDWPAPIRAYFDDYVVGAGEAPGEDIDLRWHASLVTEAFGILVRGGVCIYPAGTGPGRARGSLRLVCQANPIALIVEQAGGAASDGTARILDLVPESPQQRTPLVFGSRDKVARLQRYHEDPPFAAHRAPLFGQRGLFRL